jgi:2-alkyl-3-oxoalkanoate reductase
LHVFLTGATGVVGRRVVPLLVEAGHKVTAIGRTAGKRRLLESLGARPVWVSLFDSYGLATAMKGCDAVINLATRIPASSKKMILPWAWKENDRVRSHGSAALVNAAIAAGVPRVIQESFAPIYADGGEQWLDESWPVAPVRRNRSILDAEASSHRFAASGGTGVVLRFAAFYGPDLLMREMLDTIRGGRSPLPGDPRAFFTSIAQSDAASAVVAALSLQSGTYNVAEDEPMRRGEWVASLAQAALLPAPKPFPRVLLTLGGPPVQMLARSLRISNRKFRDATGWAPRFPRADHAWSTVLAEIRGSARGTSV